MTHITPEKWGELPNGLPPLHPFASWLYKTTHISYDEIIRFELAPSVEKPSYLSYWPSRKAFDEGPKKRMRAKPGRALMKIIPNLTDRDRDRYVKYYLDNFVDQTFEIHSSQDRDTFREVYAGDYGPHEDFETTFWRKAVGNSCMRYDFDELRCHPAEAYASGDFTLYYVTDPTGLLQARAVVYNNYAGPIYGISDNAIDALAEHFDQHNIVHKDFSWEGARLLAIDHTSQGYVAPYLDISPRRLRYDPPHLIIHPRGEIDASDHEGILDGAPDFECPCCYAHAEEDDRRYAEDASEEYCTDCLVYCDYYNEWYRHSDSNTVRTRLHNYTYTQTWCDDAVEEYAVRHFITGEYHDRDDMVPLEADNDCFVPKHELEQHNLTLNDDGKAVPLAMFEEEQLHAA